jgi:hypothetical protein
MEISKRMVIMASSVLALTAGVATTPAAFAHTDRYWAGYHDGAVAANAIYNVSPYDESCPLRDDGSHHSPNYCAGYVDGYRIQWTADYNYYHPYNKIGSNKQTIEQSSSVNIKGNNNRVVVNQQADQGVDQPISPGYSVYGNDKSSSSSNSGSQSNPRCIILCANVRIN